MTEIFLADEEKGRGQYGAENLAKAVHALKEDGIVVLHAVIDPAHIETIRERVFEDIDKLVNRPNAPFNWNRGNLQQDPPPMPPYLFRDVLANDFVIQVNRELLGPGMFNAFYSGNTAMPSENRQPVHADTGQLWPNLTVPTPPYALVVNVGLVDMSPENGSTEIWLGTHTDPTVLMQSGDIEVPLDVLEARRAVSPPFQPTVPVGSVVIRDIRLWHAGMPNRTQTPRPMMAMIHFVGWWQGGKFPLAYEAEALLKHPGLWQHANYVYEPIDYISTPGGHAYEDPPV